MNLVGHKISPSRGGVRGVTN